MTTSEAPWSRRLKLFVFGALVVAAALTGIGVLFADDQHKVALAAATAGIQLGAITVIGAVVTQALRDYNDAREDQRRLNEYRMTVFRDTVDAYNSVKTVRRTLRALGLAVQSDDPLSPEQVIDFNAQMSALNEAELSFEKIEREVGAQKQTFASAWAHIQDVKDCQTYLRGVLDVWETGALLTTRRDKGQKESLGSLKTFLAKRSEVPEGEVFWTSIREFEQAIRADLISPRV